MIIVSFSGIDGAGKSTQISALEFFLHRSGLRTRLLTFWDDVVCLSRYREFMSLKAFKGDAGVGSPEKPLHRRDKNVTSWPVTLMRFGLYLADALNLCQKVRQSRRSDADVVIFDRYIYDQIANIYSHSFAARIYGKILLQKTPTPDLAFFLDASPAAAFTRKPEYPLEFMFQNRRSFLRLRELVPELIVIPDAATEDVRSEIFFHIRRSRLAERNSTEEKTEVRGGLPRSLSAEFL